MFSTPSDPKIVAWIYFKFEPFFGSEGVPETKNPIEIEQS